jgi:hypothetical protein
MEIIPVNNLAKLAAHLTGETEITLHTPVAMIAISA